MMNVITRGKKGRDNNDISATVDFFCYCYRYYMQCVPLLITSVGVDNTCSIDFAMNNVAGLISSCDTPEGISAGLTETEVFELEMK